jgi:hypothetical protein
LRLLHSFFWITVIQLSVLWPYGFIYTKNNTLPQGDNIIRRTFQISKAWDLILDQSTNRITDKMFNLIEFHILIHKMMNALITPKFIFWYLNLQGGCHFGMLIGSWGQSIHEWDGHCYKGVPRELPDTFCHMKTKQEGAVYELDTISAGSLILAIPASREINICFLSHLTYGTFFVIVSTID